MSMTTNYLYLTRRGELRQMFPPLHEPQLRNLAWFLVGIYMSRSVHLSYFRHQLLVVAAAYCKRALPIAWTWVRCEHELRARAQ